MKKIQALLIGESIISNSSDAFSLYKKSYFGEPSGEKIRYSLSEALFLAENKKVDIYSGNKKILLRDLFKRLQKIDKRLNVKYPVFKDLRSKGYIVKTALKFGADFRVYEKGSKPGKEHAKWVVFCDHESRKMTWQDFSAKNRIAHSTKKKLLIAILDEEGDISYYEVGWLKP